MRDETREMTIEETMRELAKQFRDTQTAINGIHCDIQKAQTQLETAQRTRDNIAAKLKELVGANIRVRNIKVDDETMVCINWREAGKVDVSMEKLI